MRRDGLQIKPKSWKDAYPKPKPIERARSRAQANFDHANLVKEIKLAISCEFRRRAYVDDLTQWEGTAQEGYRVRAGMAAGTFDVFVCIGGRAVWLDAKTGGATLTPAQLEFQRWIRAAGGTAEAVGTAEEAVEIVKGVSDDAR
jgi:hypothetical protein